MKHYNSVLAIAGSDSCGGAGIQADIKTISALGCYASTAVTAVTAQNTLGVKAVHPVPADIVEEQIKAVLEDIGADSIKVGMLLSCDIVRCVASSLRECGVRNIVLDPVMVSTSGHPLMEEEAITAMKHELFPLTRIITPNIPEAEVLLDGLSLTSRDQLPDAAVALSERFGTSVLLKAGHLMADTLADCLYDAESKTILEFPAIRIHTRNTHGTGCTMSSAIATFLSKGYTLQDAVCGAKDYITKAIISGADYEIGHGHGPVNHFFGI